LYAKDVCTIVGLRHATLMVYISQGRGIPKEIVVRRIGRTLCLRRVGKVEAPVGKSPQTAPEGAESREEAQERVQTAEVILIY
jgi:hypothetical protein